MAKMSRLQALSDMVESSNLNYQAKLQHLQLILLSSDIVQG